MAGQSPGLRRLNESSSELNQLLQHGLIVGGEYEYNNAARFDGLELSGIRIVGWRGRTGMSLHDANQSVHVPSSHLRRARHRNELEHCNFEIKGEAAFVGLLQPLLNPIVIHIASFTLQLWRTLRLSVRRSH